LKQFFIGLPGPIDHVTLTAGGPHYVPLELEGRAEGDRVRV
jgi:hypothetical protein